MSDWYTKHVGLINSTIQNIERYALKAEDVSAELNLPLIRNLLRGAIQEILRFSQENHQLEIKLQKEKGGW